MSSEAAWRHEQDVKGTVDGKVVPKGRVRVESEEGGGNGRKKQNRGKVDGGRRFETWEGQMKCEDTERGAVSKKL